MSDSNKYPIPSNEEERLKALRRYKIIDSLPDKQFDDLVKLASQITQMPISLITLLEHDRQWHKAKVGLDVEEVPRSAAFCSHTIVQSNPMIIQDTFTDPRFSNNILVVENPKFRFYAGVSLMTDDGFKLGALCVLDTKPRTISEDQLFGLKVLARQVVNLIEINLKKEELQTALSIQSEMNDKLLSAFTQLYGTEARLMQAEKMVSMGQIVTEIAHEISNSVGFIKSGSQVLQENIEDLLSLLQKYENLNEEHKRGEREQIIAEINALRTEFNSREIAEDARNMIETIQEGAKRTSEIVKNIKGFANQNKGYKLVSIHEGIDNTLALLQPGIKNRIEIYRSYDPYLPRVYCHEGQINQVFMNLLSNAAQAIRKEGSISIETSDTPTHIQVKISDTGSGIPEEELRHIFTPFFSTKGEKGTGLGLAISMRIMQEHGGTIKVASEIGKGSSFTIILAKDIS